MCHVVNCHVSQAYGGAISVMVGSIVWTDIGVGNSFALSRNTACSRCRVFVASTSITNSRALSRTHGNVAASPFYRRLFHDDSLFVPQVYFSFVDVV